MTIYDSSNLYSYDFAEGSYFFETTKGIKYRLSLSEYINESPFHSARLLNVFLVRKGDRIKPQGIDSKIRNTVSKILYETLQKEYVLYFEYYYTDEKQHKRNSLFNRWHKNFQHSEEIDMFNFEIEDKEDCKCIRYASFVVIKNHSNYKEIVREIKNPSKELKGKSK